MGRLPDRRPLASATASQRTEAIFFHRGTPTTNDYGEEVMSWSELYQRRARVRFGTAEEKRLAAQEGGVQAATFECVRSSELDSITLSDRIFYLSSNWDITEIAPLDRKTIRFTGVRSL